MPFFSKIHGAVIILLIVVAIGGCAARDAGGDIPPVTSVEAQAVPDKPALTPTLMTELTEPISPVLPLSPVKEPIMPASTQNVKPIKGGETALAAAIADLSQQTGAATDTITLVSMEAKEWGDTSLGCPQEGFMYAQVITPGYLMVLAAQDKTYEYHTDTKTNVVWCKK